MVAARLTSVPGSSDVFLGWITSTIDGTTNFYFRQLRDMKGGIDVAKIAPENFVLYAEACGAAGTRPRPLG